VAYALFRRESQPTSAPSSSPASGANGRALADVEFQAFAPA
jgi:hypothetical protein